MAMLQKPSSSRFYAIIGAAISAIIAVPSVQAQALEEIVVTAQRREQSLQEVPISIEAITGATIDKQGFRDMVELSNFTTGSTMEVNQDRINITVRGIGTAGNNQALEQSAPTFVDGIHFGRSGQILAAFLDVERVEILHGPQPVYFGQNANAGAFSITSRKPTDEWQGNLRAEAGNNRKVTFEFGAGGPISDTLGIRVSGKHDESEGYMRDILTGDKFPRYDVSMGRVILEWKPADNFTATGKIQIANKKTDGDGEAVQRSAGSSMSTIPTDRYGLQTFIKGIPNATFNPIPESFGDGWGVMPGTQFLSPTPSGVPFLSVSDRTAIDLSGFLPEFLKANPDYYGVDGPEKIDAHDDLKPLDAYLDLKYTLANDIEISSLTGYSQYRRKNAEDNSGHYYLSNWTFRSERLDQWSQEFRVSSPTGGTIEWMTGVYYHINDLDLKTVGFRADVRRPARNPRGSEDAEWKSAFATVTYNFFDNKASIDLGARYSDVHKQGIQAQYAQSWIFDNGTANGVIVCCNSAGFGLAHSAFLTSNLTGNGTVPFRNFVGATPVGITPEFSSADDGGARNDATFDEDRIDPQITLRYRPTDDISLYAKYAEAFKSGGFEIELKSTPIPENFVFGSEYTTTYETGARGTFLDGRVQANVTAFRTEVQDLQIGTTLPLAVVNATGAASQTVNAGELRVQGLEFDITSAVTDRLTASLDGAVYDGKMISFANAGCTEVEVSQNLCLLANGTPAATGSIDRSGEDMPRLPSWVFTASLDYWMPVTDDYKMTFNGRFKYSDGYLTNIETFARTVQMPTHTDVNLSLGIANMDDDWELSIYGRNLTEPRKEYYPEFDVLPEAVVTTALGSSAFRTYGVQLKYLFQ